MSTDDSEQGSLAHGDHLSPDELAVWRSLLDTTADLRRRLGATLQDWDVSPADYEVLLALTEADHHELRSSDLATAMGWERSRLSHQLGRMEKKTLIRRSESAIDSRAALVSLTPEGARSFRRVSAPHLKAVKSIFADALTPEQLDALAGVLASIRKHLQDKH